MQYIRYGLRQLRRTPGFAAVAVLILGLGIGANTAIFSVVNAVLLRSLALVEPERIVAIWESISGSDRLPISIPEFLDLQRQNRSFARMAAMATWNANLSGEETPERIPGLQVSADFFEMLGVQPALGRVLLPHDAQPGSPLTVVLSYGFWATRYGGDRTIIGKSLRLNGDLYTVVGVLPRTFVFGQTQGEVIAPLVLESDARRENRGDNFLRTLGRLKPGINLGQAREDLLGIIARLRQQYPEDNAAMKGVSIEGLETAIVGNVRRSLMLLLCAVLAVILIACANLAGLFLVRASARTKEMAIRVALGATPRRLLRHLLTESMLVAIGGGWLGLMIGSVGVRALLAISPADLPRAQEIGLDARVFGFAALISLLSGLIVGVAPVFELSKLNLNEEMKQGGRGGSGGPGRQRIQHLLVVAQVAVAVVLLAASGLLLKSFMRLQAVNPGFNPSNVLVVRLALPKTHYRGSEAAINFYRALLPLIQSLPAVKSVAVANVVPMDGLLATANFSIVGRGWTIDHFREAYYRMTTPGYFHTLEIPVVAGREFSDEDREGGAPVALINETLARSYWPKGSALGAHLEIDDTERGTRGVEIVGVVGDVHDFGLENDARPEIYVPIPQVPSETLTYLKNNMCWFVRAANGPLALAGPFRGEVEKIDPDLPASSTRTMEQYMAQSMAPRRFNLILVAIFGAAALLLTGMGVYGVIAYAVAERTHEIGIRIALGARKVEVLRVVLGKGFRLVGEGVALGLTMAMLVARLMKGLLFGVSSLDPATYLGVALLLFAVALLASYGPGRRAMSVDPLVALRQE